MLLISHLANKHDQSQQIKIESLARKENQVLAQTKQSQNHHTRTKKTNKTHSHKKKNNTRTKKTSKTYRQTDRQTDGQTDRQTHRQTDGQVGKQADRQSHRFKWTDGWTNRQTNKRGTGREELLTGHHRGRIKRNNIKSYSLLSSTSQSD